MAKLVTIVDGIERIETLKYTHNAAVEQYEAIVSSNGHVLIALADYGADTEGTYCYRGRVEFDKEAALAIVGGDIVYWDGTAKEADLTNTNTKAGPAIEESAAAETTVIVMLGENK